MNAAAYKNFSSRKKYYRPYVVTVSILFSSMNDQMPLINKEGKPIFNI